MNKILLCLLFLFTISISNILSTSTVKAETVSFDDFLFEIDNYRGKKVNVESYFVISKNIGDKMGSMVSKDGTNRFNIQIGLKGSKFKEAYNFCKNLAGSLGSVYGGVLDINYYYCGFTNLQLDVSQPMQMGAYLKDISFIRDY